ncbi:hypothetical protein ACFL6N_02430 [Thermodesulfobacteriota bacterium]
MKRFILVTQTVSRLGLLVLLLALNGCASIPYQYGQDLETATILELKPGESQIERGKPNSLVDGFGHYFFSLPSKLLLWSWKVDDHTISPETEVALARYLEENGLHNVKVRLNQYSPGSEWRRLVKNKDMPALFRYTAGVVVNSIYTIFPQRVFAGFFAPLGIGDFYNPFTNTIHIYSDHPSIALHEAGHGKDFAEKPRGFKGWYALMGLLPGFSLYSEAVASGDAIGYAREKRLAEEEKDAYRILYPAYCSYIGAEGLRWVSVDSWLAFTAQLAIAIPGHIAGRIKAAGVDDSPDIHAKIAIDAHQDWEPVDMFP